jgi:hypothetical protein
LSVPSCHSIGGTLTNPRRAPLPALQASAAFETSSDLVGRNDLDPIQTDVLRFPANLHQTRRKVRILYLFTTRTQESGERPCTEWTSETLSKLASSLRTGLSH